MVQRPSERTTLPTATVSSDKLFPIVGVGSSAGGLDAYIKLFTKMPTDTGMAFILVQHLDPNHPSLTPEILGRATGLKVQEVTEGMRVLPDNVYLIPPNHNLSVESGALKLSPRTGPSNPHMTIDFFLTSLARSQGSRSIGVVLSGTGSDGTNGLEAIKGAGGITYAQTPLSAKHPGMPQNAIDTGVVDKVLTPEEIAQDLSGLRSHPYFSAPPVEVADAHTDDQVADSADGQQALDQIFAHLQGHSPVEFSNYKFSTIGRRIQRRMMLHRCKDLIAYARHVATHPLEVRALFDDLLINVTEFFRDPAAFKFLSDRVLPAIVKTRPARTPIRLWVAGCSSGEEVYSLAIALAEVLEKNGAQNPVQIFATDISERCIIKARLAIYPETIEREVSPERLRNYFDKITEGYKVRKAIRDLCLFSVHDMTRDPPFAKVDMVSCRNVLIYFSPALQKRVIPFFHYALNPGGCLFLGLAESPTENTKLFTPLDKNLKFYTKINIPTPLQFRLPPTASLGRHHLPAQAPLAIKATSHQEDVDRILLARFPFPCVVVNADMECLQFRGRVGAFIEPSTSNDLFRMVRSELLPGLRMLMQSVKKENRPARREGFLLDGRKNPTVNMEVIPTNPTAPVRERVYLTIFERNVPIPEDAAEAKPRNGEEDARDRHISELLLEINSNQDSQRAFVTQYEATQEELSSANEELQSGNEELQSTNEELETAKEELQSTNEELTTVNDELQLRNQTLVSLGSDLNNLLSATEIPILMVGSDRRIRRFTLEAEAAFNIIPSDVGRPIGDIKSNFGLDLDSLIAGVTKDLRPKDIEVQDRKGGWRRLQIRPYKTVNDRVEGAIIALVDIDVLKQRERDSQVALEYVQSVSEIVPLPLTVVDENLRLISANPSFYEYFQTDESVIGQGLNGRLRLRGEDLETLHGLFDRAIQRNKSFKDYEVQCDFGARGKRQMLLSGGKVHWSGNEPDAVLLSFVDITERKSMEERLNFLLEQAREARDEAEAANRAKDIFLATLSHELRTPLSAILTWAQLIQTGKVDANKIRHGASVIENNAKTQSQLIDDLLDISRIIAGKLTLEIQEVDPVVAINASIEAVRALAAKKNISIDAALDSSPPGLILADPVRLQQIIWNLLSNAIKFSPKDACVEVRLDHVAIMEKRLIRIRVRDSGKGIAESFLPYIFDRFSQADGASTRIHGGLGLGLSIVHTLVGLLGGTVEAANVTDPAGALFTLQFPLVPDHRPIRSHKDAPHKLTTYAPEERSEDLPSLEGIRVLIIDDDLSTCEAIGIYLRAVGAEVLPTSSAAEALEAFPYFKPHVLVSDIAMPEEDGLSLMRKVRELPRKLGKTPGIALTAFATANDVALSMAAGFQCHLPKPVEANELAKIIARLANEKPCK